MNILTITLNPAFDLHYYVDEINTHCESYADDFGVNAGGKGVNISRALLSEDTENTAYVILGKENSDPFITSLQSEGLNAIPILVEGRIRENITIHEKNNPETRISLDNFTLSEKIIDALFNEIKHKVTEDTIIAYSGRVPKGVHKEKVIDFFKKLQNLGAKISIDSNTFSLDDLIEISPWLVKFNFEEALNVAPEGGHGDRIYALLFTLAEHGIKNTIVSNGPDKTIYSGEFDCVIFPPKIPKIVSTIGAGDSMVAGFIAAYSKGQSTEDCLKYATAYATASCLRPGTLPPLKEDIENLLTQTVITLS